MNNKFILSLFLLIALQGILVCTYSSAQNVGIGTATPSEKLDVLGNLKFSGALMPNNNAGTVGRLLQSAGVGVPPTWGPALLNPGANNGFGKFYSTLSWSGNWLNGNGIIFAITDAGLNNASAATVSIDGPWNAIYSGITIRNIECEAGQLRVTAINNTGGNLTGGIPVAFIIFY
jgi:hypothetical protein